MRKTFLLFSLVWALTVSAQKGWLDMTDNYIPNAQFEENDWSAWTIDYAGSGPKISFGNMELWNCSFDMVRTVSVPNGKYRVSVQAFFRDRAIGSGGYTMYAESPEPMPTEFFVNETTKPVKSIMDEYLKEKGGRGSWTSDYMIDEEDPDFGWSYVYFPASQEGASWSFEKGMYVNTIEVEVTDGELSLGFRCESYNSNYWLVFDNFKIEYLGEVVPVSTFSISPTSMTLGEGETRQIELTVEPSNATFKTATWETSNAAVATVSGTGEVKAVSAGKATITAVSKESDEITAECEVTVRGIVVDKGAFLINEVQTSNVDMFIDPSWNYGGWVELYNPTNSRVNLTSCYVSNDKNNLLLNPLHNIAPIIPPHGYYCLHFDNYSKYAPNQVNFKLDCEGDTIYFSDASGEILAELAIPQSPSRVSYARIGDGGEKWSFTSTPTPGEANPVDETAYAIMQLGAPMIDTKGQVFSGKLEVNVTIPAGATLRYTTDGTTPTAENGKVSYSGRFTVMESTVYRFRLFQDGFLPSPVETRTYLRDEGITLPIVAVTTAPDNLYSDDYGIFVTGKNGRMGYGSSALCNWKCDWDRPANFEFFNADGETLVNQGANMAIFGGWSRENKDHPYKLKANKLYEGKKAYECDFFVGKPFMKHKAVLLRNGGNDQTCRFIDPALQTIILSSGLHVDGQRYQPVANYINGKFHTISNLREPNNKHYAYSNYGLDEDELEQFEISSDSGYVQMTGTGEVFDRWYELSKNAEDPEVYKQICEIVDVDEYANYWAAMNYCGLGDWPHNNVKGFSARSNGKWHMVMFDLDSFGGNNKFTATQGQQYHTFDYIYEDPSARRTNVEIRPITIWLNMIKNPTFAKKFVDSFCLVTGSVFEPNRCKAIIDSLAANVREMMEFDGGASPNSSVRTLTNSLTSGRQSQMLGYMRSYSAFSPYAKIPQTVTLSTDLPEARLLVNDLPVPTNRFSGTLFSPITLRAQAPAGYKFAGWKAKRTNNTIDLLKKGANWYYYDQGSLDGENWTSRGYDDFSWNTGGAPLGFSNGVTVKTKLDYGDDDKYKRSAYYFRAGISLDAALEGSDVVKLSYDCDDGFVVYVNGTEAGRYNMPQGSIEYGTFANTYANHYDSGTLTLNPSLFVKGYNVVAVEVHNSSAGSSDIYWDASVSLTQLSESATTYVVSSDEEYELPEGTDCSLVASYVPMDATDEAAYDRHPVKINEISAANSIYINEYGKKNDWIELYNTTDKPIDVEGMYISDNLLVPQKAVLTKGRTNVNTIIPAHGYLIVWADKQATLSQLHVNFKLDADSGDVVLTAADKSWADTLNYCGHNGDNSVGLYPDGSSNVCIFQKPSIGMTNRHTTLDVPYTEKTPDKEVTGVNPINRMGGLSLSRTADAIIVKCEDSAVANLTVHNAAGQLIVSRSIKLIDTTTATVSTEGLPAGIYVAKSTDEEGNSCSLKFTVN